MNRFIWFFPAGALLGLFVLLCAFPSAVGAHALLLHSTPGEHETINDHKLPIRLEFNSRIDGARSRLVLTTRQDVKSVHPIALADPQQPAPQVLTSAAKDPLAAGDYALHWIVLAADGHISRGEIPFSLK